MSSGSLVHAFKLGTYQEVELTESQNAVIFNSSRSAEELLQSKYTSMKILSAH